MKVHKDFRPLVEAAVKQGWTLETANGRNTHPRLVKDGAVVWMPGTPSDWRSGYKVRAKLRRAGVEV